MHVRSSKKPEVPAAIRRFVAVDDVQIQERLVIDHDRQYMEVWTCNLTFTEYVVAVMCCGCTPSTPSRAF